MLAKIDFELPMCFYTLVLVNIHYTSVYLLNLTYIAMYITLKKTFVIPTCILTNVEICTLKKYQSFKVGKRSDTNIYLFDSFIE